MALVNNAVYVDGKRTADPRSLDETYEVLRERRGMAWIGLYRPDVEEIRSVAREFDLHELAVEDAVAAHQRPKIERYGTTLFTVLRPARYVDATEDVEFGELHIFTGEDFVVTIRHAETPDLSRVRKRLEDSPELLRLGPEAVLYAILDQVVDEYEPVVAGLENDIDEIEDQLFKGDPAVSRRIYELSREVIGFQRATQPLHLHAELSRGGLRQVRGGPRAAPTIPRRERPRAAGRGAGRWVPLSAAERTDREQHPGQPAAERRDAQPDRDKPGPERRGQEDLGLGRHRIRPHPGRNRLRHELRAYAGADLVLRVPPGPRAHGGNLDSPLHHLQTAPLALIAGPGLALRSEHRGAVLPYCRPR